MELNSDQDGVTNTEIIKKSLKRLREAHGPSFRKFGEKIRYSPATLNRVENGHELMSDGLAELLDRHFDFPIKFTDLVKAARREVIHESAQKYVALEQGDAVRIQ